MRKRTDCCLLPRRVERTEQKATASEQWRENLRMLFHDVRLLQCAHMTFATEFYLDKDCVSEFKPLK